MSDFSRNGINNDNNESNEYNKITWKCFYEWLTATA